MGYAGLTLVAGTGMLAVVAALVADALVIAFAAAGLVTTGLEVLVEAVDVGASV